MDLHRGCRNEDTSAFIVDVHCYIGYTGYIEYHLKPSNLVSVNLHTSSYIKNLSFCFRLWLCQQKSTFFQGIIPPKISKRHALTASCLRLVDKTEAQREHLQPANWQPANWPTKNVPKESEGLLPKSRKVYLKDALKSIRFSLLKWWNISHKKKLPQGNSTSWHEFTFYHLRKVAQPPPHKMSYIQICMSPLEQFFLTLKKKWCSSIIDSLPRQKLYIFKPKKYFKEMQFSFKQTFSPIFFVGTAAVFVGTIIQPHHRLWRG